MRPAHEIIERLKLLDADRDLRTFAAQYGFKPSVITSGDRRWSHTRARHGFWRWMFHVRGYSQMRIANVFGVDASTVNYAVRGKKGRRNGRALSS